MIYTSYFSKVKKLNGICYAVSGTVPEFYVKYMQQNPQKHKRYIQFAPKKDWWFKWKKGQLNNDDFVRLYRQTVLNQINIKDVLETFNKQNKDIYLICYEKPTDFCHRHLIAEWLNENKFECRQFLNF